MLDEITTIDMTKKHIIRGVFVLFVCGSIVGLVLWFIFWHDSSIDSGIVPDTSIQNRELYDVDTASDPFPNDKDRDGIEDVKEQELGLSDVLPDTDVDGLQDNDELSIWKTDPLKFDTDGDGYGDGWEVFKGYNPNGIGFLEQ